MNTKYRAMLRIALLAAAWVVVMIVVSQSLVWAETNAACSRCGAWMKLSESGFGFLRHWQGLCGNCRDPKRRCDEAIREAEKRYESERDRLGFYRHLLKDAQFYIEHPDLRRDYQGDPESDAKWFAEEQIPGQEKIVADLLARLEKMKAECSGTTASGGAAGGEGPGSAASSSGGEDAANREAQELLDTVTKELDRLRKLLEERKVESLQNSASSSIESAGNKSIEAEYLGAMDRYAKPLADAESPRTASGAAAQPARQAPAVSQEKLIQPTIIDVDRDLPKSGPMRQFTAWQRHTANAAAHAEALRDSVKQVQLAKAAGDVERAQKHQTWALYLASDGQKTLREAVKERTLGMRAVYKTMTAFSEKAQADGKTLEQALASWQAKVRAEGLPADYVAALRKAGLSEDAIAKRREWLLSVDPKAAAATHARFVRRVAPQYLPEASKGVSDPLPGTDDLWDMLSIVLLRAK